VTPEEEELRRKVSSPHVKVCREDVLLALRLLDEVRAQATAARTARRPRAADWKERALEADLKLIRGIHAAIYGLPEGL